MDYAAKQMERSGVGQFRGSTAAESTRPHEPRRETQIDEMIERIRAICQAIGNTRVKLDRNADRLFGTTPESMTGDGISEMQIDPPLFDQLAYALGRLEEEYKLLQHAAERNCWAV